MTVDRECDSHKEDVKVVIYGESLGGVTLIREV